MLILLVFLTTIIVQSDNWKFAVTNTVVVVHALQQPTTTRREWIKTAATSVGGSLTAWTSSMLIDDGSSSVAVAASEEEITVTSSSSSLSSSRRSVVPFSTSWSAVDGLNSNDGKFVAFDAKAYQAMKDDPTRTPFFEQAILERLGNKPEDCVVVDLGTGPFALFAVIAAKLGAGKVYALEANPEVAASARQFVDRSGLKEQIQIIEGFSTDITLPEKADFIVAEIVGSIASEEGAYATILDAQRFLKEPQRPTNWIPCRIQTYAAPASYGLHNLFGPPEFDWSKLKEPVRFSCRDQGLQLLSDPLLVEDINFDNLSSEALTSSTTMTRNLTFTVDADRIVKNQKALQDEFLKDKRSSREFAAEIATKTASSFSGVAFWPRVFVSPSIIIESRQFNTGNHQRSHWQTVLPVVAARPIPNINGGETINVSWQSHLPTDVQKSPSYRVEGTVNYNA
jgi:hypothetical protein